MNCPECGAWSRVLSTRQGDTRRRECANMHRFTTKETVVADSPKPKTPDTKRIHNTRR